MTYKTNKKIKEVHLIFNPFFNKEKFKKNLFLFKTAAKEKSIQLFKHSSLENKILLFKKKIIIFLDKDINLARVLEKENIVINNSFAIDITDDKFKTYMELKNKFNNFLIPSILGPKSYPNSKFIDEKYLKKIVKKFNYPFIVKHTYGSFGQQVYLVNCFSDLKKIWFNSMGNQLIFQKYIKESKGKDIRVNVVGNKFICAMLRKNESDFRSNITLGGKGEKISIPKSLIKISEEISKNLKIDFVGLDFLISKKKFFLSEANSNPQLHSTYKYTGINIAKNIFEHIMKKYGK